MWIVLFVFVGSATGEILVPDLFHFENFDVCLSKEHYNFCTLTIKLTSENASQSWKKIEELNSNPNNYRHDLLRHGICVNATLSNTTFLENEYNLKYAHLGLESEIFNLDCESSESKYEIKTEDIILGSVLLVYVSFILCTTFVLEIWKKKSPKLMIFSVFHNFRLLINKKIVKSRDDYLFFLQGIRFATAIGVIVTHATEINAITPVLNPSYTEKIPTRFITMLLANGGMTVQVYFLISSFLLAVSFYKKSQTTNDVGFGYIVKYIARRFLRFTPAYALIIALHSTWLIHLFRSPFWEPIIGEDYRICRKNWWKNLLYFNNFVINDGLCMFHSWYLSVDFQFVILGLLFLWLTQKKPKRLFLIAAIVILFQTVCLFFVLFWNHFEIAVVLKPELLYYFNLIYSEEWQATWTTTYSNLSALVVGLCFGYLYCHKNKEVFTRRRYKIAWWIISWSLSLGPLIFSSAYMVSPYYGHSPWFSSIYGSIAKTIFALGIGLLIFGFSQGLGNIIKQSFEWGPMYTLGQLSFGAYLAHFTLLKINAASRKAPPFVSDFSMFSDIITNVTMSYLVSIVLTLVVLMPVSNITARLL